MSCSGTRGAHGWILPSAGAAAPGGEPLVASCRWLPTPPVLLLPLLPGVQVCTEANPRLVIKRARFSGQGSMQFMM